MTVVGATNTPSLQLDGGLGDITLYAGLNLVTSNQNTTAPAILNVGGNNVINGTISPTNGGSGVGSTRIKVSAGTLTLNGNISPASTATSARTLILDGAGNGTVNGVISNGAVSLALTKDGTGTWVLNQANTFTGAVSVLNGTLEADNTSGSATGTGAVTVGSGGRLQGTGTIAGAVTVQSGGALQGGAGTPGTLTFSNKLTLSDGSSTEFHIADSASYDQIVAHQLVVGSGSTSTAVFRVVLDNGFTPVAGDSFHLLDWSSLLPGDTNLADNFDFSQATLSAGLNWDTSAFHSSGLLSVVAIPEPSRVLLLVISTGGWMLRRRRWPCN